MPSSLQVRRRYSKYTGLPAVRSIIACVTDGNATTAVGANSPDAAEPDDIEVTDGDAVTRVAERRQPDRVGSDRGVHGRAAVTCAGPRQLLGAESETALNFEEPDVEALRLRRHGRQLQMRRPEVPLLVGKQPSGIPTADTSP